MMARRSILLNALRVAATQYDNDAVVHGDPLQTPDYKTVQGRQRVVRCVLSQEQEARDLADKIEQACRLTLED